jgi:hypothetical protein
MLCLAVLAASAEIALPLRSAITGERLEIPSVGEGLTNGAIQPFGAVPASLA